MNAPRILIAGIGNIFMGDDAFGCEVARRLSERPQPEGVKVVDFGIRSLDLIYAVLDGYDAVILVDAAPRGHAPGTLFVLEPETAGGQNPALDGHSMDPVKVLEAVAALGGNVRHILVVGCEPSPREAGADWEMSLSEPVRAALDEAVAMVELLVRKIVESPAPAGRTIDRGVDYETLSTNRPGGAASVL